MPNKQKLSYNPLRDNRPKCFNTDANSKQLTENCRPLDNECATQQSIYQELIEETYRNLANE